MSPEIISRYKNLQRQYTHEVIKKYPSWTLLQRLTADIQEMLLTYPELRSVDMEPSK